MSKYIFNTVKWVLLERGGQVIFAFLLNIVLARHLGVYEYGVMQFALGVTSVFASAALICSAELILPIYGTNKDKFNNIFSEAFFVRLALQGGAFLLLISYCYLYSPGSMLLYFFLGLSMVFIEPANAYALYFQFHGKQNIVSMIKIIAVIVKFSILIGLVYWGVNIDFLGVAYSTEALIIIISFFFLYKKFTNEVFVKPSYEFLREVFKNGFVFGVAIFFMVAFQNLDKFFLKLLEQKINLGLYSVASQISSNIIVLSSLIVTSVSGKLIYTKNSTDVSLNIKRIFLTLLFVYLFICLFVYLFSELFIVNFFGVDFLKSSDYLKSLSLISIFAFSENVLSLKILKDKKSFLFAAKWIIAFFGSFLYGALAYFNLFVYNPVVGVLIGYSIAALFSFSYYILRIRNEK